MNHDTQSVLIDADPNAVVEFVGDGANLPRWAIGFASAVEPAADGWVVVTSSGDRVPTSIRRHDETGTVDFVMAPAPGVSSVAWARCLPAGSGSLFTFTQVQAPGMPDEVFVAQVAALGHELVALKAVLEVSCPR